MYKIKVVDYFMRLERNICTIGERLMKHFEVYCKVFAMCEFCSHDGHMMSLQFIELTLHSAWFLKYYFFVL